MANPEFLDIFPVSVMKMKGGLGQTYRSELSTIIQQQSTSNSKRRENATWTGDVSGYNSLHLHPKMSPLLKVFRQAVSQYMLALGVDHKALSIFVSRCWGTYGLGRDAIARHNHHNSALSIVYYLKAPEGCSPLTFHVGDHANEFSSGLFNRQSVQSGILQSAMNFRNAPAVDLAVEEDLVVVFPSALIHSVKGGGSTKPRISVAADTFVAAPKGMTHEFLYTNPAQWQEI